MRFLAQETKGGDAIYHIIVAYGVAIWKIVRQGVSDRNPEYVLCIPDCLLYLPLGKQSVQLDICVQHLWKTFGLGIMLSKNEK